MEFFLFLFFCPLDANIACAFMACMHASACHDVLGLINCPYRFSLFDWKDRFATQFFRANRIQIAGEVLVESLDVKILANGENTKLQKRWK